MSDMEMVVSQVKVATETLLSDGWVRVNPGEVATPDLKLWFGSVYVTGEYTVHASHREQGFGVPRGNIRIRITPALAIHHPQIGLYLAHDLQDARATLLNEGFEAMVWPPPIWAELSVQGVVDHR